MKVLDLSIDVVYTNGTLFRNIIAIYDGTDGERRVQYEKGYFRSDSGEWSRFGVAQNCTKKNFARWAKEKVKRTNTE